MAKRRKSQAKKPKLISDRKLTQDRSGRIRIGGRFASSRQVAAIKAARTRRGLETRIKRPSRSSEESQARRRSLSARKAAATRRLNSLGITKLAEFRTPEANFLKITYDLPDFESTLIQAVSERILFDHDTFALNLILDVSIDDDAGGVDETTVGTRFFFGALNGNLDSDSIGRLSEDAQNLVERYGVFSVNTITLVVSPRR